MATFTTPTTTVASDDWFMGRFNMPVGISVMWNGAHFVEVLSPWLGEIADLEEGVTFFGGGRTYHISIATADQLILDGFEVQGYGYGLYGQVRYE